MSTARGYAALESGKDLVPFEFERRDVGPGDVQVEITHAGVCHSDIHTVNGDWGDQHFPIVPGHEIVGRVVAVGSDVTGFAVGDYAGVGVYVDSCRECDNCLAGHSHACLKGMTGTYANPERHHEGWTQGGYSTHIVVDQGYVVHVPDALDPAGAAPLLCAGITLYSPLKRFAAGPGKKVAVVGLGGLGHMGVKFAVAMGAEVTVISHSPEKEADAKKLGAHHFLVSSDEAQMDAHRFHFDLILNTVSVPIDVDKYLELLGYNGTFVQIGLSGQPYCFSAPTILNQGRSIVGSMIGSVAELQDMLNFAGEHGIHSDVEVIAADYVNTAYERVIASDVRYRFVIDASTI
jgi:uncharacterized zinc-type alcohol dehydrogenase-like protein